MRISAVIIGTLLLAVTGCTMEPREHDSFAEIQTQYMFMHELMNRLTPEEHKIWESYYSDMSERFYNSPANSEYIFDYPEYIKIHIKDYRNGLCSGYAYFKTTQTKLRYSMFRENSPEEEAYVQGWYEGQSDARSELLEDLFNSMKTENHTDKIDSNQRMDLTRYDAFSVVPNI